MKVIIGAQKEEIESIKDLFTDIEEKEYLTIKYLQGKIHNQDCVLAQGGIGAAATVMLITLLKTKFDIEYIINVGTAGGVANKGLKPRDVVISDNLAYLDADVTAFGYKYGQMAGCPRAFKADENLVKLIKEQNPSCRVGDMLSGDKFVCDKHNPNAYIQEHFDDLNILTTDMESTSLANACYLLDIPFVVVRVVSDILESVGQKESYEEVLKVSSLVAKEVINKLI